MDDQSTVTDAAETRRKILKRAGIGAAAAWSVPLVLSRSASAAPGGGSCAASAIAAGATHFCVTCPACDNSCGTSPAGACCCFTDVTGCCFCGVSSSCGTTACSSNNQCPPGYRCAYTCCTTTVQCIETC